MQSIAEWLDELGLGQYTQLFAENGIDFSALGHLSDQDLRDLGVLLGHRRKLQAAIAGLLGTAPTPLKTVAATIMRRSCQPKAVGCGRGLDNLCLAIPDQRFTLSVGTFRILFLDGRNWHHSAVIGLTAQPPKDDPFKIFGVKAISLRATMLS
jgi:hypothetical protein